MMMNLSVCRRAATGVPQPNTQAFGRFRQLPLILYLMEISQRLERLGKNSFPACRQVLAGSHDDKLDRSKARLGRKEEEIKLCA